MSGPKTSILSPNFVSYSALSEEEKRKWLEKEMLVCLKSIQQSERLLKEQYDQLAVLTAGTITDDALHALLEQTGRLLENPFEGIREDQAFSKKQLKNMQAKQMTDVSYSGRREKVSGLEQKYLDFYENSRGKELCGFTNIARGCALRSAELKTLVKRMKCAVQEQQIVAQETLVQNDISRTSFYLSFGGVQNRGNAAVLIEKINRKLSEITGLVLSDALLERLHEIRDKASAIRDASYLGNFLQLVVMPFIQECHTYHTYYTEHFEDFEELQRFCQMMCQEQGKTLVEQEFSPEALQFYREQAEALRSEQLKQRSREAVMQTVHDVMTEMGYELLGSRAIVRKSGKQFHDDLYLFEEGTAISVVQSPDGQMTMEIGGLDDCDRMPTASESKHIEGQMEAFCRDYTKITSELQKRGVALQRVSELPPDQQYAMIINLSDYSINSKVQTITEIVERHRQPVAEAAKHREES